jgi:hypothetical protein
MMADHDAVFLCCSSPSIKVERMMRSADVDLDGSLNLNEFFVVMKSAELEGMAMQHQHQQQQQQLAMPQQPYGAGMGGGGGGDFGYGSGGSGAYTNSGAMGVH